MPPREPSLDERLAHLLVQMGLVSADRAENALQACLRQNQNLGDVLLARGQVTEADLMQALTRLWGARVIDLADDRPDPRLLDLVPAETCLTLGLLPWRRFGATTVVATAHPESFDKIRSLLPVDLGRPVMALAPESEIQAALLALRKTALIRRAEVRVAPDESCRTLNGRAYQIAALALGALMLLGATIAPQLAFLPLFLWAFLSLTLCGALKAAAFGAQLLAWAREAPPPPPLATRNQPVVSVMVALFREELILPQLVRRLNRLTYPRELLDILLVVEEDDHLTRAALARLDLPGHMRVITVPDGPIRTKPRALNFALDFCKGSIVGIYDAEDVPAPDQILTVVRRFQDRGPKVACVQGVLDFYNASHNWLTRCFAAEYAGWFRVVLPGIARLGLVVPLGGTSVFFRRAVLEELGGWDAYNVTEDADLGLRLARHGYVTELIPTVTDEEPNGRALPWVKQRSRWIKGYTLTWAVHSRDPVRLWRDLGPKRFIAMQILFLGTISEYALAPLLWSFWLPLLGLPHPIAALMPHWATTVIAALFALSEGLNLAVGLWAVRGRKHRHLLPWVPTLHFYFPLGSLAAYKAIREMVRCPFYWDKTAHGHLTGGLTSGGHGTAPGPLFAALRRRSALALTQQAT